MSIGQPVLSDDVSLPSADHAVGPVSIFRTVSSGKQLTIFDHTQRSFPLNHLDMSIAQSLVKAYLPL